MTFWLFLCKMKWYKGDFGMKKGMLVAILGLSLLLGGCTHGTEPPDNSTPESIPPEEVAAPMRGVWLSFLELDPLFAEATPASASAGLDKVMDTCRKAGLDTLFFHVRAHGDAYYPSTVYPAAEAVAHLLAQGFDPLAYAVEAAHSRGLAIHAWINPYRLGKSPAGDSFEKAGVWYANPGSAAARGRVLDGVREVLTGYAVDGIHFDDYFYPAGMAAGGEDFEAIPAGADVGDWRRTQVDVLVSSTHSLCRQTGRVFGISPMASVERCRTEAFADVTCWMRQPGYVDYICPQLYTGFLHETSPFDRKLAEWVALPRNGGVRLYIGLALYKAGLDNGPHAGSGSDEWATHSDIVARQATALRPLTDGFVLFRYGNLTDPAAENEVKNLLNVF